MKNLIRVALLASSLFVLSAQAVTVTGVSSAKFNNPLPLNTTFSGTGTNSFTWGDPGNFGVGANNLTFTGTSFSGVTGSSFKLGTLSYFNGTTATGSNASSLDFSEKLTFTLPGTSTVTSNFTLALNSTPNTSDPVASADFVTLSNPFSPTRFVIGGVTYQVNVTGFRNVIGDGFLVSDSSQFHVLEGRGASAELFGSVTAVPEPETYAMMLAGLGMMGLVARRRKAAVKAA